MQLILLFASFAMILISLALSGTFSILLHEDFFGFLYLLIRLCKGFLKRSSFPSHFGSVKGPLCLGFKVLHLFIPSKNHPLGSERI